MLSRLTPSWQQGRCKHSSGVAERVGHYGCFIGSVVFSVFGAAFVVLAVMIYRGGRVQRQVRLCSVQSESPIFASRTFVRQYIRPQWISWNYREVAGN